MLMMLTNEANVLNPKNCGVQGPAQVGGIFFLIKKNGLSVDILSVNILSHNTILQPATQCRTETENSNTDHLDPAAKLEEYTHKHLIAHKHAFSKTFNIAKVERLQPSERLASVGTMGALLNHTNITAR